MERKFLIIFRERGQNVEILYVFNRPCVYTIYAVPTEFPISVNCKNKVNYGGRRFYTLLDPTVVHRQL